MRFRAALLATSASMLAAPAVNAETVPSCMLEVVVLGAGQDAGAPQIGNAQDDGPSLLPASLGVVDRSDGKRYLFDASPAITQQLALLDMIEPPQEGLGLDGIFLTHAHIGHYLGLAYLGREAAGAHAVPVYAMPRMGKFLTENGPWSQLVELGQIELRALAANELQPVSDNFGVWPISAPHRDEFSETVGFIVMTPRKRVLYIPDLDNWGEFEALNGLSLTQLLGMVDYAFIDATFWDDDELAGRDMSEIPHPRVTKTMDQLQDLPTEERAKVHFIHYNHTNPVRHAGSGESREVSARGFDVARRGNRFCLD